MFKPVHQIPYEGAEEERAQEGNSDEEAASFNCIALLHKKVGGEGGKGGEGSVKPEPGKAHPPDRPSHLFYRLINTDGFIISLFWRRGQSVKAYEKGECDEQIYPGE